MYVVSGFISFVYRVIYANLYKIIRIHVNTSNISIILYLFKKYCAKYEWFAANHSDVYYLSKNFLWKHISLLQTM